MGGMEGDRREGRREVQGEQEGVDWTGLQEVDLFWSFLGLS